MLRFHHMQSSRHVVKHAMSLHHTTNFPVDLPEVAALRVERRLPRCSA